MMRPLLDLYCGAGGASMGYQRAGFSVVGVDLVPQPNYPFMFVQADALEFLDEHYTLFSLVHASPPCQAHTNMSNRWRGSGGVADSHLDLITPTREHLIRTGKPYVLENVVGARKLMHDPIILDGGMFGLGVHRPRLFESNLPLVRLPSKRVVDPVGVYGALDGRLLFRRSDGSEQHAAKTLKQAQAAMGIDWMDWKELTEAIPPAYTEWIGTQLLTALEKAA